MRRRIKRQFDPKKREHAAHKSAPPHSHRGRSKGILQHQRPSNDPRHDFAHRGIAVCVGTAGNGNHGRKLRIAKSGEDASDARDDEGKHNRRPRKLRRRRPRQYKNSGADNGADAECGQINGSQRSLERMFAFSRSFVQNRSDWLGGKEPCHTSSSRFSLRSIAPAATSETGKKLAPFAEILQGQRPFTLVRCSCSTLLLPRSASPAAARTRIQARPAEPESTPAMCIAACTATARCRSTRPSQYMPQAAPDILTPYRDVPHPASLSAAQKARQSSKYRTAAPRT